MTKGFMYRYTGAQVLERRIVLPAFHDHSLVDAKITIIRTLFTIWNVHMLAGTCALITHKAAQAA